MTNSRSGNVIEAAVCPTLEVFVTAEPVPLEKKRDPESGLALIDPRGANKDSVSRPSAMLVVGVQCAAQKEALRFVVVPFWPFRSYSL